MVVQDNILAMAIDSDEQEADVTEGTGIKVKNIYGIPDEDEKKQALSQKKSKQQAQQLATKKQNLKDAFAKFSKTLTEADFDEAVRQKKELAEKDNVPLETLDKIKINTNALMKKNFQFPEVAKNDFAANLFDELEISEKNLNSNLDNVDLFNAFVEEADKVKKALKEKYGDQWTDPADGEPEKPKEDDE